MAACLCVFLFLSWRQPLKLFSAGLFKLGHGEFLRGLSWFTWYRTWTWAMAYLISDKRHGNEVYVTKEVLNMASPLLEWQVSGVVLCSQLQCFCYLARTAQVPLAIIYFQCCIWRSSARKEKEGGGRGGLQSLSKRLGICCFSWKAWCLGWRDWCGSWLGCKFLHYTELGRSLEEQQRADPLH